MHPGSHYAYLYGCELPSEGFRFSAFTELPRTTGAFAASCLQSIILPPMFLRPP